VLSWSTPGHQVVIPPIFTPANDEDRQNNALHAAPFLPPQMNTNVKKINIDIKKI
jgi:hypothetical protein